MSQRAGETVTQWYERAIVANSVAAGELDDIEGRDVNETARRVIGKRAAEAAADLDRALDALLAERRALRGPP